jgi:hypothetical protein
MSTIIPAGGGLETSGSWDPARTTRSANATVLGRSAKPGWMAARSQENVDPQDSRDTRQDLQTDALGQSILDHRPCALADPAGPAQPRLGLEPGKPQLAQLAGEVEDHLLDRLGLVTELVRHSGIRPCDPYRWLISPSPLAGIAQGKSSLEVISAATLGIPLG